MHYNGHHGQQLFFFFFWGTQHQTSLTSCWRRPQSQAVGRGLNRNITCTPLDFNGGAFKSQAPKGAIAVSEHPSGHAENFGTLTAATNFLRWKRGFLKDVIMTHNYQVHKKKNKSKVSIRQIN
jgi:hypothetical protein